LAYLFTLGEVGSTSAARGQSRKAKKPQISIHRFRRLHRLKSKAQTASSQKAQKQKPQNPQPQIAQIKIKSGKNTATENVKGSKRQSKFGSEKPKT
jgi:hypothetical protein